MKDYMIPSNEEKARLRKHYQHIKIQFRKDGNVYGKKGDCWGILLTEQQLSDTLKLWRTGK